MKLLLLPLFLAACLQVEHTSEDLSDKSATHVLHIAEHSVFPVAQHKDEKYKHSAHISELKLKPRTSFGHPVEHQAGTPLKDRAPLEIAEIVFAFESPNEKKSYACTLKDKKLRRAIHFSSSDCNKTQATAVYGQYLLSSVDGNDKLELAVKIEIGRDGKPSQLHVKDFTNGDGGEESVDLTWDTQHKAWSGGDYTLGYPNLAESIAKMIGNKKLPSLTQGQDRSKFSAKEAKAVLSAKQYEALLPMSELTSATMLNDYFNDNCLEDGYAGSSGFTTNGQYSYLEFSKAGLCGNKALRLYGLNTHAVVQYLKASCNASCPFVVNKNSNKIEFLLFTKHELLLNCDDFNSGVAFYVNSGESNKLYMVDSLGDDRALWYNCHDSGSYGRLGDAAIPKARSAQSSAGDSKIRSRDK